MLTIHAEGLEAAMRAVAAMPGKTERVVRLSLLDAARHARAQGLKRTREAYLARRPRKAKGFVRGAGMRREVQFAGGVGTNISRFPTDPGKPRSNARRSASGYVSARVKSGGAMRPVLSPTGERAFWLLTRGGARLVWHRPGERRLHGGLMAASPIQALQKRGAMEELAGETGEYLLRRVSVNMERAALGEMR